MRYALLTLVLAASPAVGQNQPTPDRVGRIVIEGNAATPDQVILRQFRLRPGQVLDYKSLEDARTRLSRLVIFDDEDEPIVEVIPSKFGEQFVDIRIRVKERPHSWFVFAALQVEDARATRDPERMWGDFSYRMRGGLSQVWVKLFGNAP